MRILYGVVGEGMGHATRSRVVLERLVKEHEVHVVVSGRARDYLAERFANVHRIWGLTIAYEGNSVRNWQTLLRNVKGALTGLPENVRRYFELVDSFAPDVVISDFESFSYLFGRNHRLPVISVDNMQIINRCRHSPELIAGYEDAYELSRSIVKGKVPGSFHYLISTFFEPEVRKQRTTLVPPILRPEILEARSEPGEHLLVYQTATSNTALPKLLSKTGLPCRIYGMRRDLTEALTAGPVTWGPVREAGFMAARRTARAVIAGGGFPPMSGSVYLPKPVLSVPIGGQFEQVLNALYLQQLGYGMHAPVLAEEALGAFLERLPDFEQALKGYQQQGNDLFFQALEIGRAACRDSCPVTAV